MYHSLIHYHVCVCLCECRRMQNNAKRKSVISASPAASQRALKGAHRDPRVEPPTPSSNKSDDKDNTKRIKTTESKNQDTQTNRKSQISQENLASRSNTTQNKKTQVSSLEMVQTKYKSLKLAEEKHFHARIIEMEKSNDILIQKEQKIKIERDVLEEKKTRLKEDRHQYKRAERFWCKALERLYRYGLVLVPCDDDETDEFLKSIPESIAYLCTDSIKKRIVKQTVELSFYETGETTTNGRNSGTPDYEGGDEERLINGYSQVDGHTCDQIAVPKINSSTWNFEYDSDGELGSYRVWQLSASTGILLSLDVKELKYTDFGSESVKTPLLLNDENGKSDNKWSLLF